MSDIIQTIKEHLFMDVTDYLDEATRQGIDNNDGMFALTDEYRGNIPVIQYAVKRGKLNRRRLASINSKLAMEDMALGTLVYSGFIAASASDKLVKRKDRLEKYGQAIGMALVSGGIYGMARVIFDD
jgi:hypothetical protein